MNHHHRAIARALAGVLGLAVLAACGAPAPSASTPGPAQSAATAPATAPAGDSAFPVEVASGGAGSTTTITIAERPDAIISLSPTATETLFAIGAGEQVKAVDDQSNFPADAPRTELSGFTPNVEAILGEAPDLVVMARADEDVVASLATAGVPTLVLPSAANLTEAYDQMERLGAATGRLAEAKALVAKTDEAIDAAVASVPERQGETTYFHELDPTLYTVTGGTFIGEIYGLFGLTSIGDAAGTGDLYPQLSEEFVVEQDPDLIFLSDTQCCGVTLEQVKQRPGWAGMAAVEHGRVHSVNEDIASRWGPRVADFAASVAEQVKALEPAQA